MKEITIKWRIKSAIIFTEEENYRITGSYRDMGGGGGATRFSNTGELRTR